MTVEEQIAVFEHNAEHERKEGDLNNCLNFRQLAEWLKELQAHREAWEKVYKDIEQLTTILYESSCEGDWQYGVDKYDVLDIIDKNRPKEADAE